MYHATHLKKENKIPANWGAEKASLMGHTKWSIPSSTASNFVMDAPVVPAIAWQAEEENLFLHNKLL